MAMTPYQLRDKLKGIVSLVITPFKENGDLDVQALKDLLKDQVKQFKGKDLVFLAGGSTAEFYAMNDEEYKLYAKTVVEAINGEIPVIMGTARCGTRYTIEASKYAQDVGADGVMVVNSFYHVISEESVYQHFKEIADAIKIGLVVYNNPTTTKLYIYPEQMKRLSKIDNIVGLKDNTSNPMLFKSIFNTIDPKDMTMFTGLGEVMYLYTSVFGCQACVMDIPNYVPDIAFGISDAAKAKDFVKMKALIDKVDPVYSFIGKVSKQNGPISSVMTEYLSYGGTPIYQSVIKEAMKLTTGRNMGKVRAPMYNLKQNEIDELREILKTLGAL